MDEDTQIQQQLAERFRQLPPVIQQAIKSADIEKHLRDLANTHQLHLDQWGALENEVMLTLMGFQPVADLEKNIRESVETTPEIAAALARDISEIVFGPVRGELERILEHPAAQTEQQSDIEVVRGEVLGQSTPATPPTDQGVHGAEPSDGGVRAMTVPSFSSTPSAPLTSPAPVTPPAPTTPPAPAVAPATPPAPAPESKAVRGAIPATYAPGLQSHERKDISGDPYREQV